MSLSRLVALRRPVVDGRLSKYYVRNCGFGSSIDARDKNENDNVGDGDSEVIPPAFSHLDASGRARMVDVSQKPVTTRTAIARARIIMPSFVVAEVERQNFKNGKGDVLTVAQIAGICGAKKTPELIPLCHNIPLSKVDVALTIRGGTGGGGGAAAAAAAASRTNNGGARDNDASGDDSSSIAGIDVVATVKTDAKTGVEMEALTAALVAALTVYDMCKALAKDIVITDACLVEKSGGKETYRRREA